MSKTQKVIQKGDPAVRLKNQIKSVLCNPFNLLLWMFLCVFFVKL